jgi:DNA invertase Pin-like site-specific DNA recombinase
MKPKQYVAYYRVSTVKQGMSGLGLEAQRKTVADFTREKGGVIGEFVEVETGKHDERAELHQAIALAKDRDATLVIAKLDRLSRNVSFIFELRDSGVDFLACDLPDANTLTIGIFAAIAQHEQELISQRTKAALAVKKAQGYKLGSPQNLTDAARRRSVEVRRSKAGQKHRYSKVRVIALEERRKGRSLRGIAGWLNENGYRSARGRLFQANTVKRLLN